MSRFFKSAAFPILIVVVLAFFAQRLISPSDDANKPREPAWISRLSRIAEAANVRRAGRARGA